MNGIHRVLFLALCLAPVAASGENTGPETRFRINVEVAPVWVSNNDVEIPNDGTATRFDLTDVIGSGPFPSARAYLTWNAAGPHRLRLLAAPLTISETGDLPGTTRFDSGEFTAGAVDATYRFNSWRLTYAYQFANSSCRRWWVGLTAKVRDAEVKLSQGDVTASKTDVGFVPLLHVRGEYDLGANWMASLDVDALAGGPGRAIDGALFLQRHLGSRYSLAAGYRTVEGGADVNAVYNFAWLHYAVLGVEVRF